MTYQPGVFFLCGRVRGKEGRLGFLACSGDEQEFQVLPHDVLKLQIQLYEQETIAHAYVEKFRLWFCSGHQPLVVQGRGGGRGGGKERGEGLALTFETKKLCWETTQSRPPWLIRN